MDHSDILDSLDSSGELSELVKTRKWKTLLDLCDKRSKKDNTPEAWQICKATALLLDERLGGYDLGRRQLVSLLSQSHPVTDPTALSLLESLAQLYNEDAVLAGKLGQIWERAAGRLSSNGEWVYQAWFQTKFRKGLYKEAKQAAMAWMKAFPREHDPFYLFILVNHILSRSTHVSDMDRKLCQMLAFRALATAAVDTVDKTGQLTKNTGRVLTSPEDLLLLSRIYKDQGKHEDALGILEDPRIGWSSSIGSHSWELKLEIIELQGICGQWKRQWRDCQDILREARPSAPSQEPSGPESTFGNRGDDWKIWEALVIAASKLHSNDPESVDLPRLSTKAYGEGSVVPQTGQMSLEFSVPKSRNASLAMMKLYAQDSFADPGSKKLFKKCQKFFEDYSTKIACFQDLRPHLSGLSRTHQEMLVANITRHRRDHRCSSSVSKAAYVKAITSEITSLKIEYNLIISRSSDPHVLSSFASLCLRLYNAYDQLRIQLPQSDRGSADDAAILAAMALVQLYHIGHKEAIFRCIIILEYLLSRSKHNYDALLILVRLYMYSGMGSMALDRYARLSIKNIQHATMSWIMVIRLSTIHPWPRQMSSGGHVTFDPLEEMDQALDWHQTATTLTDKALDRMIATKKWGLIFGLLRTQDALQNGFGRAVLRVEGLRIQRLRQISHDEHKWIPLDIPEIVRDNRDRTAFPNYQPIHQPTFEESLPTLSIQTCLSSRWLIQEYGQAHLWDQLESQQWSHLETERLKSLANHTTEDSGVQSTISESHRSSILSILTSLLPDPVAHSSVALPKTGVFARLDELKERLELMHDTSPTLLEQGPGTFLLSEECRLPSWQYFHDAFTMIDTTRFVLRCINRWMNDDRHSELLVKLTTTRRLCQGILETVRSSAAAWRKTITSLDCEILLKSGNKGIRQGTEELGEELYRVIGADMVGSICALFRESYIDALDGVIRSITV